MSGSALIGVPATKPKAPAHVFEAGGAYTSTDGTLKAVIGAVRRGKYSSRVLAQIEGEWRWHEIGITTGCELFTAELRRGVFVFQSATRRGT